MSADLASRLLAYITAKRPSFWTQADEDEYCERRKRERDELIAELSKLHG